MRGLSAAGSAGAPRDPRGDATRRMARVADRGLQSQGDRADVAAPPSPTAWCRNRTAEEVPTMAAQIGDRIIVESQRVGQAAREGEVLEIIEASYGTRYRVHWDDGQESTIRPAAGSARTIPPAEQVEAPGPEARPTRRRGAGRTRKGS